MRDMKTTGLRALMLLAAIGGTSSSAFAATVLNSDKTVQTLVVTEGASKQQVTLQPGETVTICPNGCFVTFPNGDRTALSGSEAVTILNGGGTHK